MQLQTAATANILMEASICQLSTFMLMISGVALVLCLPILLLTGLLYSFYLFCTDSWMIFELGTIFGGIKGFWDRHMQKWKK